MAAGVRSARCHWPLARRRGAALPPIAPAIGMEARQGRDSARRGSVRSTTARPEGIAPTTAQGRIASCRRREPPYGSRAKKTMYNLLVSGNENDWNGEPFVLARSRCLSRFTDPEIGARFDKPDAGQVRELCSLPCVFAYEAQCGKDPRFGVDRRAVCP